MRYVATKDPRELALEGIQVDVDTVGDELTCVTLTDINGKVIRLAKRDYSFRAEIPAPPKTVKRYRVSGTVLGLPVVALFETAHAAENACDRYRRNASPELVALTVEPVDVEEDSPLAEDFLEDLPF